MTWRDCIILFSDTYNWKVTIQEADISADVARAEWSDFKYFMFSKRREFIACIDAEIASVQNPASNKGKEKINNLKMECRHYTPIKFGSQ